ncbi:unnamed protein product, partial [Prorocentrum cordatum]
MLHTVLLEELAAQPGGLVAWPLAAPERREAAVARAFARLDEQLSWRQAAQNSGSTCVAAVTWPDAGEGQEEPGCQEAAGGSQSTSRRVLLANLGDSRGLVLRASVDSGMTELLGETTDHKPDEPGEWRRIVEANGIVTTGFGPARVDGDLALSRAFGDFRLKSRPALPPERQMVSMVPDVYEFRCCPGDVIVLACDGVFDVVSSSGVNDLVGKLLLRSEDPAAAARGVVLEALDLGSTDNVSCLIVQVLRENHMWSRRGGDGGA